MRDFLLGVLIFGFFTIGYLIYAIAHCCIESRRKSNGR